MDGIQSITSRDHVKATKHTAPSRATLAGADKYIQTAEKCRLPSGQSQHRVENAGTVKNTYSWTLHTMTLRR